MLAFGKEFHLRERILLMERLEYLHTIGSWVVLKGCSPTWGLGIPMALVRNADCQAPPDLLNLELEGRGWAVSFNKPARWFACAPQVGNYWGKQFPETNINNRSRSYHALGICLVGGSVLIGCLARMPSRAGVLPVCDGRELQTLEFSSQLCPSLLVT